MHDHRQQHGFWDRKAWNIIKRVSEDLVGLGKYLHLLRRGNSIQGQRGLWFAKIMSRLGFLNHGITDIWGQILICGGRFRNCTHKCHPQSVTNKNVSKCCHMHSVESHFRGSEPTQFQPWIYYQSKLMRNIFSQSLYLPWNTVFSSSGPFFFLIQFWRQLFSALATH